MKKFSLYPAPFVAILCATLLFSCSSDDNGSPQPEPQPEPKKGTFTDARDDKPYKTIKIGTQTWMAENLNYNANGSKCGTDESEPDYNDATLTDENTSFCDTYGRLYDWATATAGVCPDGWHIPSKAEWITLMKFVNPSSNCPLVIGNGVLGGCEKVGGKLKAVSGWNDGGNGTDAYGWTALPGGYGFPGSSISSNPDGYFYGVGEDGQWWSGSEFDADGAYFWIILHDSDGFGWNPGDKTDLHSVRCLHN